MPLGSPHSVVHTAPRQPTSHCVVLIHSLMCRFSSLAHELLVASDRSSSLLLVPGLQDTIGLQEEFLSVEGGSEARGPAESWWLWAPWMDGSVSTCPVLTLTGSCTWGRGGMRPELQLVEEVEFGEATSYPDVHTTEHKEGMLFFC